MCRDSVKYVGLSLGNSELRMIVANTSFASKSSISDRNYDCEFCALNIIQVDMFWYWMMTAYLIPYSTMVSPAPLIILSRKTAVHAWAWSSSSLCFMLGLTGDYWNLMDSFSMKLYFRSQRKTDGGEAKYVEGYTSEHSQGGHRELFLVKELPTQVISTVNLTGFFFPCSPCCSNQEN